MINELVGSIAAARASEIVRKDVRASLLIAGEPGTGQRAISNGIAKAFLCVSPGDGRACGTCASCGAFERSNSADLLILSPVGKQGLIKKPQIVPGDDTEEKFFPISEFLRVGPVAARNKVVLIEDAERLTLDAANALLKALEEPPAWCRFILTTSAAGLLPPTVRSRCLLLSCDFADAAGLGPAALALSGGAQETAARLESDELRDFAEGFFTWVAGLGARTRPEALKASEEFQEWADTYAEVSQGAKKRDIRPARAEFVQLFANGLAKSIREGNLSATEMLERTIELHRALQGNVNFAYLVDSLFCETLGS